MLQLSKTAKLVIEAKKTAEQIKKINSGIDAVRALGSVFKMSGSEELYGEWKKVDDLAKLLKDLHVDISKVKKKKGIEAIDEGIKRGTKLQKRFFEFQKKLSKTSSEIEKQVEKSSPKGAAKLTAQGVAVLVEAQSKMLAAQRLQINLVMQEQIIKNHERKMQANHIVESIDDLADSLTAKPTNFDFPRRK